MSDDRTYNTKDYSRFRLVKGNRPVTAATIAAKIRELKRHNLFHSFPAVVKRVGTHLDVYDGQNRVEACKVLGLPVYYKINDDITLDDVAHINTAQTKWTPDNYLSLNVVRGNKNYEILRAFVEDTKIPLSVAIGLLAGVEDYGKVTAAFKQGKFVVRSYIHACEVAGVLNIFRDYIRWATDRSFVLAISRISQASRMTPKRLNMKLVSQSTRLVKCANWLQYVEIIDCIYNHRVRPEDIVPIREDVRVWVARSPMVEMPSV